MEARLIGEDGLQALIEALAGRGYTVVGPTVQQGAVVNAPVSGIADLPAGWGDEQDAGHYRLRRRDDGAFFGFASGAQSAKPVFFPTEEVLWRGGRDDDGFSIVPGPEAGEAGPYALVGVRSCDLAAVGIHDEVLLGRGFQDAAYAARRAASFVVAVTCSDPGGTCFCVSMDTGPRPRTGRGAPYDLSLTELLDGGHRFVVEVVTRQGEEVLDEIGAPVATPDDLSAGDRVAEEAAGRMGRTLDTDGIKELLYAAADSPRWDDVASRCLSCSNCTAVCPTCFCTTVEDVTDLAGREASRSRVWDSCFTGDFSALHGDPVRATPRSRYRQWMTHKLASWIDQFGMSGCVGCGRCISWCPAAIDLTEEAAALRAEAAQRAEPGEPAGQAEP